MGVLKEFWRDITGYYDKGLKKGKERSVEEHMEILNLQARICSIGGIFYNNEFKPFKGEEVIHTFKHFDRETNTLKIWGMLKGKSSKIEEKKIFEINGADLEINVVLINMPEKEFKDKWKSKEGTK